MTNSQHSSTYYRPEIDLLLWFYRDFSDERPIEARSCLDERPINLIRKAKEKAAFVLIEVEHYISAIKNFSMAGETCLPAGIDKRL